MRLDALFDMKSGVAAARLNVSEQPSERATLALVRPSSSFLRTVAGYVDPDEVDASAIQPQETVFVSTNGQGSHSYAYVAPFRFLPNSDVVALCPKRNLSLLEKLYYAACITMNRPRFSYGRKPKGERLASIELPDEVPEWVRLQHLPVLAANLATADRALDTARWMPFNYTDLFEIVRGKGPSLSEAKAASGPTPYVTASEKNNGISAWTAAEPRHPANCLTVATNGSVGECFVQPTAFAASSDVAVLMPKRPMAPEAMHFVATLIRREGKLKYGYGRKWGLARMETSTVLLPAKADGSFDVDSAVDIVRNLPSSELLHRLGCASCETPE